MNAAPLPLTQVNLATKDLELYSRYVPGGGESIFDVDKRVRARGCLARRGAAGGRTSGAVECNDAATCPGPLRTKP